MSASVEEHPALSTAAEGAQAASEAFPEPPRGPLIKEYTL